MRSSKLSIHWNIRDSLLLSLAITCLKMVARAVHFIASACSESACQRWLQGELRYHSMESVSAPRAPILAIGGMFFMKKDCDLRNHSMERSVNLSPSIVDQNHCSIFREHGYGPCMYFHFQGLFIVSFLWITVVSSHMKFVWLFVNVIVCWVINIMTLNVQGWRLIYINEGSLVY
jgi:hypothetical protein